MDVSGKEQIAIIKTKLAEHQAVEQKQAGYAGDIPKHELESLARVLLPSIRAFFESEAGQREFAEWQGKQAENERDRRH